MSDPGPADVSRALARWSETLAAIARTGLGFTQSLYERERYEEILHVAADIRAAGLDLSADLDDQQRFVTEWLASVGEGVPGYVTPKCSVGAIVGNPAGEILLVQRPQSGYWLFPTGWADVGYSPAEVVVKEVFEETGIRCRPEQLLSVVDGQRMGISSFAMYLMVFHCTAIDGELRGHPLETADLAWFSRDRLPERTAGVSWWGERAFRAIDGEQLPTEFDAPRPEVWRAVDEG